MQSSSGSREPVRSVSRVRVRWYARIARLSVGLAALLVSPSLLGVEIPHSFKPRTVIRSAEVNANFEILAAEISASFDALDEKQDKLASSDSIEVSPDNTVSIKIGTQLQGEVVGGEVWSVVNNASTDGPSGCNGAGGGGIYGQTASGLCGAYSFAGVLGESIAEAGGVGVLGSSASRDGGFGVMGTYGGGPTGAALLAYNYGSSGAAIRTYGGTISVDTRDRPMAFVHRAQAQNTTGDTTCIDSPLSNGDPSALVTVTHNLSASSGVRLLSPVGVAFDPQEQRWCIVAHDGSALLNHAFNVMILKQSD